MSNLQSGTDESMLLLESLTSSILITTPDLDFPGPHILYVNEAFEKMTGWRREEVIGENPRILQGPRTDLNIFDNLRSTVAAGGVWKGQTVNYKKDGTEFYMEWSIAPVFGPNGEIDRLLAVQTDVTENVEIEERLKKTRIRELKRVKEIEKANIKLQALTEKQKSILELFTKYVPATVVKEALANAKTSIKEGVKLEVALLFCDIRGFTSIAQSLDPKAVVQILDTYYSRMAEVVKMYDGVINQFTGDEIFVTFGAPTPIEDPVLSSVYCAIEMIRKLQIINEDLSHILNNELSVGIGLNYGPVIAGNLGSDDRLTYAITGDAVNTAKRIETLSSDHENMILMSESVHERSKDLVSTEPWGEVSVKGRAGKIMVFQIIP